MVQNVAVEISVTEAKGQLTELVRRAEQGEEIILTRHGHPAARIIAVKQQIDREKRKALLEALYEAGKHATPGPSAARSQDYLYDDDGLPA
jgi:prevent-host-death family protein